MNIQGTILIADDNDNNLRVLSTMLRSEGYNIRIAKNGEQVLKSVSLEKPEIILLDIHMPVMDGFETCQQLKAESDYKDIPIIFISALTETASKVKALEMGGVDYITKPFQVEEVKVRVSTHILLRRKTVELEQTLDNIKKLQTKLIQSEKMATLGILVAGIAHEINNPINFVYAGINSLIKNFAELEKGVKEIEKWLSEHKPDVAEEIVQISENFAVNKRLEVIPQLAEDIKTGAVRTTEIIKGLRLFSRSEKEKKTNADVIESLETALLLLKNKYKNRIQIIKHYPENLKPIDCYPGQLTQAFINLIHNAIDAIEKEGTIQIDVKNENSGMAITIADSGVGIPPELLSKIFDPFFTTKAVGGGMGMGLAITHGIIQKHMGNIQVDSVANKGTSFKIFLPSTA